MGITFPKDAPSIFFKKGFLTLKFPAMWLKRKRKGACLPYHFHNYIPFYFCLLQLCDIISSTLDSYIQSSDREHLQYETELYKVNTENVQTIDESERGDVKITGKVLKYYVQLLHFIPD